MSVFYTLLLGLFVFLCLILIASVLLQTGRGGGMAGLGGGASDSAFGAHTANILQKFTGVCVIIFFVMVIMLAKMLKTEDKGTLDLDELKQAEKKPAAAATTSQPLDAKASQAAGELLKKQEAAKTEPAKPAKKPGLNLTVPETGTTEGKAATETKPLAK